LIRKWLKAGVLEDDNVTPAEMGTPQGAVISPLLANIYLHYFFDLWVHRWRRRQAQGNLIVVRYADDTVIGFEHQTDAERFISEMRERVAQFGLSVHPQKTRLIEFGRQAARRRADCGLGKPETFNFLGFTHICARTRRGAFALKRLTRRDRMQAALRKIKEELHRNRHHAIPEQGARLRQILTGYFAYHAEQTNAEKLSAFRHHVVRTWLWALRRRSQKDKFPWERIKRLAAYWLPRLRAIFIPGLTSALPLHTRGGSPVRELRTPGSVREVSSDGYLYRDNRPKAANQNYQPSSVCIILNAKNHSFSH
jgi:RNA-directed DNA polymerase